MKIIKYVCEIAIILLLATFYLLQTPKLKQAYWLWDEANSLYRINAYAEANESFAEALPVLKQNGLFLQQYAKALAMQGKHVEVITMLTKAENYYKDEFGFIAMGDAYKATEEYQKAEEQYLLASNVVPHKFYPLVPVDKVVRSNGARRKGINTCPANPEQKG